VYRLLNTRSVWRAVASVGRKLMDASKLYDLHGAPRVWGRYFGTLESSRLVRLVVGSISIIIVLWLHTSMAWTALL